MKFIEIRNWRVYIAGHRLHHGRTGEFCVALGLALIAHDWKDRPFKFVKELVDPALPKSS